MKCDLILALDVPSREEALEVARSLRGSLDWIKVGLQLYTAYGPDLVRELADLGYRIFLDLKLHDIPNTVARAVESLATLPISMLTLHAAGGREMLQWARRAQSDSRPDLLLLGVTVLTSMDGASLREVGVTESPSLHVQRLARLASEAGLQGLVCSPLEISLLRGELGSALQLVTPGIRPAESGEDDQKRVRTPAEAARAGANYLVVGRPILKASDRAAAAVRIRDEVRLACAEH